MDIYMLAKSARGCFANIEYSGILNVFIFKTIFITCSQKREK